MEIVLFVFPTLWDPKQLEACRERWSSRTRVAFAGPADFDCPWNFDALGFIEDAVRSYRETVRGVTTSSDYPGAAVAAALSARLGLAGTDPGVLLAASNKYAARLRLAEAVPEACPPFALVDPAQDPMGYPDVGYPCFVKPVKGAFSVLTGLVRNRDELAAFLRRPAVSDFVRQYVRIHETLTAAFAPNSVPGGHFLLEGYLPGRQVTVEGFAREGKITTLGVVDSVLHPETGSFLRFDYPSDLAEEVQNRLEATAEAAARALGLTDTLFNVELVHDPETDRIGIIEVNVRMCGQFADLHEKVDGTSTYEIALDLAAGRSPRFTRGLGPWPTASSVPLRVFDACRVDRAPGPEQIREIEARFPGTVIWTECREGDLLEEFESLDDGHSARYGVINLGGESRDAIVRRAAAIVSALDFRFTPLPQPLEPPGSSGHTG